MRAALVCLTVALLLACEARAEAGDRGASSATADTVGWWIDEGASPAALVDSTLKGEYTMPTRRGLHYPDGRGGFQSTTYDTVVEPITFAQYDILKGTSYLRLPNAHSSRIRLSYGDVFEMILDDTAKPGGEPETQDAMITLVAQGVKLAKPGGAADVAMYLIVMEPDHPERRVTRSLRPLLPHTFGYPGDTITIQWRARPGDRIEVRVAIDATGRDLEFMFGYVRIETRLIFERLLDGAAVRSVRTPPPRPPMEQSIKSIYR
jgi:hypothetical protein